MKSPENMRIIQIDITNACIHQCSNCTRFCGHHKKPFFMDYETFKRAVDSLDGYVGTIGMMGGEPTLNPEFERMAEYLATKKPFKTVDALIQPQEHFMDEIHDLEMEYTFLQKSGSETKQTVDGPGLWSAIGEGYKKHYETIQDTIQYQALNDHSNPMYHQPALISRKDLMIPDNEWIKLRDACWVQNLWSACITPKGAFFCEIAGALDMLFDGSGGWEIEPGWWKRKPKEFGDQLHWCELCGLACETFMRNANEEIDDVSETLYKKLKEIDSPGISSGRVNLLKINNGIIAEESKASGKRHDGSMPYTESYSARFDEDRTNLYYKKLIGVYICDERKYIDYCIEMSKEMENFAVYTKKEFIGDIKDKLVGRENITYFPEEECSIGYVLYQLMNSKDYNSYLMILKNGVSIRGAIERLHKLVLNPGVLLYRNYVRDEEDEYFIGKAGARALLLNGFSHAIRYAGWDRILKVRDIDELRVFWEKRKIVRFSPDMEKKVPRAYIEKGKRYVVYGAGRRAEEAADTIRNAGAKVVAVVDSSVAMQGESVCGYTVKNPQWLVEAQSEFDKVMISAGLYYKEIKEYLLSLEVEIEDMAWI